MNLIKIMPQSTLASIRIQTLMDTHKLEFILTGTDLYIKPISTIQAAVIKAMAIQSNCEIMEMPLTSTGVIN